MDIFESLENLNVSEECFKDIINIVEKRINEVSDELADKVLLNRAWNAGVSAGKTLSHKSKKLNKEADTNREKFFKSRELWNKRDARLNHSQNKDKMVIKGQRAFSDGVQKGKGDNMSTPDYAVKGDK